MLWSLVVRQLFIIIYMTYGTCSEHIIIVNYTSVHTKSPNVIATCCNNIMAVAVLEANYMVETLTAGTGSKSNKRVRIIITVHEYHLYA